MDILREGYLVLLKVELMVAQLDLWKETKKVDW